VQQYSDVLKIVQALMHAFGFLNPSGHTEFMSLVQAIAWH
jgi:hypothetical protein